MCPLRADVDNSGSLDAKELKSLMKHMYDIARVAHAALTAAAHSDPIM